MYKVQHMYTVTPHRLHTCVCGHGQLGKLTSLGGGRKTTEANGNNKQWPSINDYTVSVPTTDSTYTNNGHSIKDRVLHNNNMMGKKESVTTSTRTLTEKDMTNGLHAL